MDAPNKNIFFILAVMFICIFLQHDLSSVSNMEARNFITAREILENGSWLLPTMNGELRIAKPPLPTWITALAMMGAGTDANLVVNRIPAGICAGLLSLFTFLIAKRVFREKVFAVTALLVLATGYLFMWSAKKNSWDIYACTAMAGAIWTLLEAFLRKQGKARYFIGFSLLLTASFYSKGPVAFWDMLGPFLISYCMVYGTKDIRENKRGLLWGFALCVVLSALWPAYVYLNTPHAAAAVAATETTSWFTNHLQPVWYYLANLQWVAGIWLFFLLYGLVFPFIEKDWRAEERLFVFWFILTIVFLSLVPEKKIRYLLPAVIPGAIVSTIAIYRLRQTAGTAWKFVYGSFCFMSGLAFIGAAAGLIYVSQGRVLIIGSSLPLGLTGAVLLYQFITKNTFHAHITAIVGICLIIVFLLPVASKFLPAEKTELFLRTRDNPELQGREFYFLDDIDYEIIWAVGKKIRVLKEGQIRGLEATSAGAALITTEAIDKEAYGMRLGESIEMKKKTYNIYLLP